MVQETIGEQLDDALAKLATKQDLMDLRSELKQDHLKLRNELHVIVKAAVQELVQVINQNTDNLCKELNRVGVPVRTRTRHTSSAE